MHSGEQKVLGVRWNVVADQFVHNLSDVVVVHSKERHRGFWKLARVEDTIIGRDGHTRGAVDRVHAKDNYTLILQSPIQRLHPLYINCHIEDSKDDESHISEN